MPLSRASCISRCVSPLRGEWIEIFSRRAISRAMSSRLSEASGLKYSPHPPLGLRPRSRLSEASGLKSRGTQNMRSAAFVSPLRGEWIEISCGYWRNKLSLVSPLRGEWIEMRMTATAEAATGVLPLGGEWIEIFGANILFVPATVSPLRGETCRCIRALPRFSILAPHGASGLE